MGLSLWVHVQFLVYSYLVGVCTVYVCTSHCFISMEIFQCILIWLVHASCICTFPSLSCTQLHRNSLSNVLQKYDPNIFLVYEFLHLHIFLFIHFHSLNKCSLFQALFFYLLSRESIVQMPQLIAVVYELWRITPSYTPSIQDAQIPIVRLMPPYTPSTWDARFQDAWKTIQFQLYVFNSLSSIFMMKLYLAWVVVLFISLPYHGGELSMTSIRCSCFFIICGVLVVSGYV